MAMQPQWSAQQERALDAAGAWTQIPFEDAPIFYLAGFAGTGKTTLAKHLAEAWGNVAFAAFTGKAAHVLRSKGCDASTIHSLIYITSDETREMIRQLEEELEDLMLGAYEEGCEDRIGQVGEPPPGGWKPGVAYARAQQKVTECKAKIERAKRQLKDGKGPKFSINQISRLHDMDGVIIDECSMVDQYMGEDLLSFKKKILVLGDPAQLPPIRGGGFFTARRPDFVLTEVHRQARESGILRLATDVREGNGMRVGAYGADCEVVRISNAPRPLKEYVLEADQMLVGKNATRRSNNARFRQLQGRRSPWPEIGERLVCLQNHHKIGLLNGSSWAVNDCRPFPQRGRVSLTLDALEEGLSVRDLTVSAHSCYFEDPPREPDRFEKGDAECFDYAYAQTVHKAQGSQWDSVVLQDESGAFRENPTNWLYTGITRAAKRLVVLV